MELTDGSTLSGIKKIVKNEYNGFLSHNNEKIANRILKFLNKEKYNILVNNVNNNFSNINNSQQYFEKIKEIYI